MSDVIDHDLYIAGAMSIYDVRLRHSDMDPGPLAAWHGTDGWTYSAIEMMSEEHGEYLSVKRWPGEYPRWADGEATEFRLPHSVDVLALLAHGMQLVEITDPLLTHHP